MKQIACVFVSLWILVVCTAAWGEEPETKRWKNEAELAFVNTTGNSDVLTAAIRNELQYRFTPKLTADWKIGALKS